ncbi:MAG: hypothetical protein WBI20_05775 [Burkholderiaceae bacterium]
MSRLDSRVAKLEQKRTSAEDITIVIRFISPGNQEAEIRSLKAKNGELWHRHADEPEQELIDRATRQTNQSCASVLLIAD